jgi:hypothetical protein
MEFLYLEYLILFGIVAWLLKDYFSSTGIAAGLVVLALVLLFMTNSAALIGIIIAIILGFIIWNVALKGGAGDVILWVAIGVLFFLVLQ